MEECIRRIETDELVVFENYTFSVNLLDRCRKLHIKMENTKEIIGTFDDDKWMAYSGLKYYGLDFNIDEEKYASHIGKEFGISLSKMKLILKCYAMYNVGIYIYSNIASLKINAVKTFLEQYGDPKFIPKKEELENIIYFLAFINTPISQIQSIKGNIKISNEEDAGQRKLKPIINYMVIENEINSLFNGYVDKELLIKWFPIFFWVNITFILPLRATEMLVTPFNCIERKNDQVYLSVRRTKLKKGKRKVYADVNKDYEIFEYEIPDNDVVKIIEKYRETTKEHERRFLFDYKENMINEMLSLAAFNHLIGLFMDEYIMNNTKYDYAKYATNIKEFERVTAGDSRPIAMANLYFQNAGEDICRQLANHVNINTSSGYYTNISETILNSSIIQLQKRINNSNKTSEDRYKRMTKYELQQDKSLCLSPLRKFDDGNIEDCEKGGFLDDCMGCEYYVPTKTELEEYLANQKEKADRYAKRIIEFLNNISSAKNKEISLEELFLNVQTEATKYKLGCDIQAEELRIQWQKRKNSQKTSY